MGTTKMAEVNGTHLSFEVWGHAASPKMVLLHALGERATSWEAIAEPLAESFEVFAPDLRGHGDSAWPGSYSFDLMLADVVGLFDHLDLRSAVLVGHSMGGVVAYLVAIQRPDLVQRLIVEDVSPPYRRDRPVPSPPSDASSLGFDWAVVPAIVHEVNAGAPALWADLARIGAPTLLIGGGGDSHIPQDKLRDVAEVVPNCELVTIPAGHHVHANEPSRFVEVVTGWLEAR